MDHVTTTKRKKNQILSLLIFLFLAVIVAVISRAGNSPAFADQDSTSDSGAIYEVAMPMVTLQELTYFYYDDFSNPNSGWPVVDNTHVSNDCFRWYYNQGTYNAEICDDRTDVKVGPLVRLPDNSYEIEVVSRFNSSGGWWTSYGILFDAKDDPDPSKPNLGDYYMIWVLWEGSSVHKWLILKDIPGDQIRLTEWEILQSDEYNYGSSGNGWNKWKIVRTADTIDVYVNDNHLKTVNEKRPTTNFQYLFGLYTATFETGTKQNPLRTSFDSYKVVELEIASSGIEQVRPQSNGGTYTVEPFTLDDHLPKVQD